MALDRSSFSLFGLDLIGMYEHWRQGWVEALQWPLFARLMPDEVVRVVEVGGVERLLSVDGKAQSANGVRAESVAVVLPDDIVLLGALSLPLMSPAEQRQAVELAVQAATPFPLDAIVWGYRADAAANRIDIEYALAARDHIQGFLERHADVAGSACPEVWAMGRAPIVLGGFGETPRLKRQRQRRIRLGALAIGALLLSLMLAALPVLQSRQQVFDAQARFESLAREVAPVVADREVLGKVNAELQVIGEYRDERPDPTLVLARLTELLPDSVYLTRFEIRGRTVVIGGLAQNAAGLMEVLGAQPDFRDVRAPAAIALDRATGRESFAIEFKLAKAEGG